MSEAAKSTKEFSPILSSACRLVFHAELLYTVSPAQSAGRGLQDRVFKKRMLFKVE